MIVLNSIRYKVSNLFLAEEFKTAQTKFHSMAENVVGII